MWSSVMKQYVIIVSQCNTSDNSIVGHKDSRHRSAILVSCFHAMDGVLMCEPLCAGLRGVTTAGARRNHRNIGLATATHHQHIVHRKPGQNRAFCTVNKVS